MKHSNVKQKIIETASALFYENGYNLTGINEIIAKSGVAKATLYNHFKSKEDICLAYLKYQDDAFMKELKSFIDALPEGEDRILGIFEFLDSFYNSGSFNGCWCLNTVVELPKDNVRVRETIKAHKMALRNYFEQLVEFNLDTENSTSLGQSIYLLYEGALAESQLQQDSWPIVSAKAICQQIM